MNLFGVEIKLASKGNSDEFVRRKDCHKCSEQTRLLIESKFTAIEAALKTFREDINRRVDDALNAMNNYIDLLKK